MKVISDILRSLPVWSIYRYPGYAVPVTNRPTLPPDRSLLKPALGPWPSKGPLLIAGGLIQRQRQCFPGVLGGRCEGSPLHPARATIGRRPHPWWISLISIWHCPLRIKGGGIPICFKNGGHCQWQVGRFSYYFNYRMLIASKYWKMIFLKLYHPWFIKDQTYGLYLRWREESVGDWKGFHRTRFPRGRQKLRAQILLILALW